VIFVDAKIGLLAILFAIFVCFLLAFLLAFFDKRFIRI